MDKIVEIFLVTVGCGIIAALIFHYLDALLSRHIKPIKEQLESFDANYINPHIYSQFEIYLKHFTEEKYSFSPNSVLVETNQLRFNCTKKFFDQKINWNLEQNVSIFTHAKRKNSYGRLISSPELFFSISFRFEKYEQSQHFPNSVQRTSDRGNEEELIAAILEKLENNEKLNIYKFEKRHTSELKISNLFTYRYDYEEEKRVEIRDRYTPFDLSGISQINSEIYNIVHAYNGFTVDSF